MVGERFIFPSAQAFRAALAEVFIELVEALYGDLSPKMLQEIGFISLDPEARLQTTRKDWKAGNQLILETLQNVSHTRLAGAALDFVDMLHGFIRENCMEAFLRVAPVLEIDDEFLSEEDLAAAFADAPSSIARSAQILLMIWWTFILPEVCNRLRIPHLEEVKTIMMTRRESLVSLKDWGIEE